MAFNNGSDSYGYFSILDTTVDISLSQKSSLAMTSFYSQLDFQITAKDFSVVHTKTKRILWQQRKRSRAFFD
ncbi:hypothetical protein [Suttonella ornithocola]|uniref:Uncharacterized protein n=1 Tax=Suttonella ornithocola TaxID=279832 RepID=A0A380MQ65_9GAMM|nr:hypothetical protein [Suttonella ornithocola]SUO94206.1 Uncharacterised protein [Suttonella ornithocola]